jgi:predicted phosphodiesterase
MTHRFLLASDIHYTTDLLPSQLKQQFPDAIGSAASGDAFGYTQKQKVDLLTKAVCDEHEKANLDAVLFLGDLSIDDYSFRNLPENYCLKFKNECLDRLPCPYYVIPGNHDSYPNADWMAMFGTDRQHTVAIGDCVFLMLDTFAATPANSASGSPLTMIDDAFLQQELHQHAGRKIFICAHHIEHAVFSDRAQQLIAENPDIKLLFRGHTHINDAIPFADKTLIDIGGYAYNGMCIDGRWEFGIFDPTWAWGYQILEIDDAICTYHVKPALEYHAANGHFSYPKTIENEIRL